MVPRRQVRAVHPLGPLRDTGGRMERQALAGPGRMGDAPLGGAGQGVREARVPLQPGEVQRRRMGEAREGRGHEVHRHHVEAPRRLRDVQVEREPLQHRRRDAVQARHPEGARRRLRARRHPARFLLLAVAGLARAQRRRERLGLRPRRQEGLRPVPARQGRAAGEGAADQLRQGGADLVRHAAHDDRRSRAALRQHRPIDCSPIR